MPATLQVAAPVPGLSFRHIGIAVDQLWREGVILWPRLSTTDTRCGHGQSRMSIKQGLGRGPDPPAPGNTSDQYGQSLGDVWAIPDLRLPRHIREGSRTKLPTCVFFRKSSCAVAIS